MVASKKRPAAGSPALVKSRDWILSNQVLGPGDWEVKNKDAEPGWLGLRISK